MNPIKIFPLLFLATQFCYFMALLFTIFHYIQVINKKIVLENPNFKNVQYIHS